ncbi:MAG: hypothetical protein IJ405_03360 [Lachnospiraceae bacterium]|nr:hypothetical protein [Lachnospiraceae bacterium]
MDNLRAVIKNLFCYVSPQAIIENKIQYDGIDETLFLQLGSGYITQYSNDELLNMYNYLRNEFQWQKRKLKGEIPTHMKGEDGLLNVFEALIAFDYGVLIEENGMPLCQYVQLLRWREMITVLEEDLFITSFLAYNDNLTGKRRKNFFWKPVIGHNNRALNCLVSKGVAENHFHLKGSAPQFHLSWISLMNQVDNMKFAERLEQYENNRLQKNLSMNANYPSSKLTHMWQQAVLIRLFLFSVLKEDYLEWGDIYVSAKLLLDLIKDEGIQAKIKEIVTKKKFAEKQLVNFDEYAEACGSQSIIVKKWYSVYMTERLLHDREMLEDYLGIVQENIYRFQEKYGKRDLDYMICEVWLAYNGKKDINGPLSGERWFLYTIFSGIYSNQKEIKPYINWFYLYLVIKANIRRELVQTNVNVGFDNFYQYQNRKDIFIEDSIYEKIYVRMAVRDTIYNQHIRSLEARITPKKTVQENLNMIRKYDKWITESLDDEEDKRRLQEQYFYVIHFIKESERVQPNLPFLEEYRSYKIRENVKEQALAIASLRERGCPEAARIKGIDACSAELWCRAEVFAQAFRYLKNHWVYEAKEQCDDVRCKNLFATYHVGEDFLDILDGLRAIDEAIVFLNLRCGDRLGHALALGVDIDDWYASKTHRILINKMAYIDNLVWLYAKLRRYNIEGCDDVKSYIEKRFREYFAEIYENNIVQEKIQDIIKQAKAYFDQCGIKHSYNHNNVYFGINEYYDAWKLRGDNPELYRDGFFKIKGELMDEWDEYAVNKEYPQNYQIRYNPETALLYYMYHFDPNVKIIGDQMIEVKIRPNLVDAIKKVRNVMQREICSAGIGIETNPSSNYLIGTFRRYDQHPITKWYNCGLTLDAEALQQCPQMQVSINTDDQGVFSTYIENEYAYLALALEKCKDEKGAPIYNRTMILQWLDHIREMGIDQSFDSR